MMAHSKFAALFNALFAEFENTVLVNGLEIGKSEPFYTPAIHDEPAQIVYAHGFISSAMHEVAHWCYAGLERRKRVDYGYWYAGEQRNQQEQYIFEQVELVPQAYESLLCQACGIEFKVSLDNFNDTVMLDREHFTQRVLDTAQQKLHDGLSPRLVLFLNALAQA